ncbi:hypothetical protein J8Y17_12515 [Bacillus cereus]|uniref:hypothetical protein n=1 Tax=Bacillus sp. N35-10-4 TaxID=1866315 RepID=UPI0008FD984B|nr:hypothetical protein J8Y17_12515 [Bacillus cereus]UOK49097.1 transposase [Bacillus tropicus]
MPRIKDLSDSKLFTIDKAIYSPFRKRKQFRLKLTLYNLNLIAMSTLAKIQKSPSKKENQ